MKTITKIYILLIAFLFILGALAGCVQRDISLQTSVAEKDPSATQTQDFKETPSAKETEGNTITGDISETRAVMQGQIRIAGIGDFSFNPETIKSVRDDLFNKGYFSIFDILVMLDDTGKIEMQYRFDNDMNTYVIDSINGIQHWWYSAYYDGGWSERSAFRMDHYPYKDKMYISIINSSESQIESYHEVFREEIIRKNENDGRTIVPKIILKGPKIGELVFENIEVKPHNLRNDMLTTGTITAIDAIMTLGDEGKIEYELFWYESIGTADIVKNYWVNGISEDKASGRCGFVYEEGSLAFLSPVSVIKVSSMVTFNFALSLTSKKSGIFTSQSASHIILKFRVSILPGLW